MVDVLPLPLLQPDTYAPVVIGRGAKALALRDEMDWRSDGERPGLIEFAATDPENATVVPEPFWLWQVSVR